MEKQLHYSDRQALDALVRYIDNHANDLDGTNDMAMHIHFSASKLNKVFKQYVGIGPASYLRKRKMILAKQIRESENKSWTEIAYALGYADLPSFSKAYKRFFGYSPKES
jgi:AraC-like DNA-binding protein